MRNNPRKDTHGLLVDNKSKSRDEISESRVQVPVNRNLSRKLFGQVEQLMDRKI